MKKTVIETSKPASLLDTILAERRGQHGVFAENAALSQALKQTLYQAVATRGAPLAPDQREALEMVCHKMARIVSGDPNLVDHWSDIAGYATLVANRLAEVKV